MDNRGFDDLPVEERLRRLLEHLGIERAHVAGRLPRDWRGLLTAYPKLVASMTLLGPTAIDVDALRDIASRVLVVNGDHGPTAERVRRIMAPVPEARVVSLPDYAVVGWTDLALERTEEIAAAMRDFLVRVTGPDGPPRISPPAGDGEVAGISYRIRGAGPPLLLLPLWLSPSQWEPLIPRLSERYCTILLGGPALGAVAILESRGRAAAFRSLFRTVLDELALEPGQTVLDVGSGTGVASRWLAAATRGANRIIGVDINGYLLREATTLVQQEGLEAVVSFRNGSAEALPFPEAAFDAAVSVTVIEEVDADRMLAEMVRVTRPGGRVAVVARAMDLPPVMNVPLDARLKGTIEAPGMIGEVAPRGCADASLYARARRVGLTDLRMFPYLAAFDASAATMVDFLQSGLLSRLGPPEVARWREARARAEAEGTFFMGSPHHCVVGTRD